MAIDASAVQEVSSVSGTSSDQSMAAEADVKTPSAGEVKPAPAQDPFQVDDAVLASLSPESRTAVEPILNDWKNKARERFERETKSNADRERKVKAFDQLVSDKRFQDWYRDQTNPSRKPEPGPDLERTEEPQVVTAEEWVSAAKDPERWADLQTRNTEAVLQKTFGNILKETAKKTKELELSLEFEQLTRNHSDIDEMDKAGILEPFLFYYKDLNGRTMEEAYQAAKKVWNSVSEKANARVNGSIQEKKSGTTEKPSSASHEPGIEYAATPEEARRMQIKAAMENRDVTVLVKRK